MVLLPGCKCCQSCGFDAGVSVECDITSSPAYGYLQKQTPATSAGETFQTTVVAWSIPTPTVSLASIAGPSNQGEFYHYCFGNAKIAVRDFFYRITGAEDFPCSNFYDPPLLSSHIIQVRLCRREFAGSFFPDAILTVRAGGARIMSKRGTSNVPPLSSSVALSDEWIEYAISSGWEIEEPQLHFGEITNTTQREMFQSCSSSLGKQLPFTSFSPSQQTFYRPLGNIGPTLSSGGLPISITDSYAILINTGESLIATTLPVSPLSPIMYYLEFVMSVDAVRLLFESSEIAVFS